MNRCPQQRASSGEIGDDHRWDDFGNGGGVAGGRGGGRVISIAIKGEKWCVDTGR